jgi:hypothetical protein
MHVYVVGGRPAEGLAKDKPKRSHKVAGEGRSADDRAMLKLANHSLEGPPAVLDTWLSKR